MSGIEERTISVGGQAIHLYRQASEATAPIVFVHGWGSSGRMWMESFSQLRALGTCIALDLPGHGRSSRAAFDWFTLDNMISAVWQSIQALGIERPVLVGHSLGGEIVLALGARHPLDVARLIAVAPAVTGEAIPWGRWAIRPSFFGILRTSAAVAWPALGFITRHRILRRIAPLFLEPFRLRDVEDLHESDPEASLATAVVATTSDITSHLPSIAAPTLIVVGTHDLTILPREGRLAARLIPGARLVELPSRHHPFAECPGQFFPAVVDFLRS